MNRCNFITVYACCQQISALESKTYQDWNSNFRGKKYLLWFSTKLFNFSEEFQPSKVARILFWLHFNLCWNLFSTLLFDWRHSHYACPSSLYSLGWNSRKFHEKPWSKWVSSFAWYMYMIINLRHLHENVERAVEIKHVGVWWCQMYYLNGSGNLVSWSMTFSRWNVLFHVVIISDHFCVYPSQFAKT